MIVLPSTICLSETSLNQSCASSRSCRKCYSNHTSHQIIHNSERWKLNHSPQNTTPSYTCLHVHRLSISRSIIETCHCRCSSPLPHGYITPFNIYVTLSRGMGCDNIRLLQDFDKTLLQQHPNECLRLEDQQIHILNENIKNLWEIRKNQEHDKLTSSKKKGDNL